MSMLSVSTVGKSERDGSEWDLLSGGGRRSSSEVHVSSRRMQRAVCPKVGRRPMRENTQNFLLSSTCRRGQKHKNTSPTCS